MIVNKNGKLLSNIGTPVIEFSSLSAYEAWKSELPSGVTEEDFVIVLSYTPEVGSYVQADSLDDLNALDTEMKKAGVLYGAILEEQLYYFDEALQIFKPFLRS